MADLGVQDATLTKAQAAFRAAANRLAPVARALQGLNAEVVGADPLAERFGDAQRVLAADLGITGQALAELAAHVNEADTALGSTDEQLTQQAKASR